MPFGDCMLSGHRIAKRALHSIGEELLMPPDDDKLYAYQTADEPDMAISRAPIERDWMDFTDRKLAYRCLPLVIANQSGWTISNPADFTLLWNGGDQPEDLQLDFSPNEPHPRVLSHFGHGVLTFRIPWLFRTPPGINLWVKGASNWIKDGAQALEGIVETDWTAGTFTMNWRATRVGEPVSLKKGEPICMFFPIPRGLAAGLQPVLTPISRNTEVETEYEIFKSTRLEKLKEIEDEPGLAPKTWYRDYFRGLTGSGKQFPDHETVILLKDFESE